MGLSSGLASDFASGLASDLELGLASGTVLVLGASKLAESWPRRPAAPYDLAGVLIDLTKGTGSKGNDLPLIVLPLCSLKQSHHGAAFIVHNIGSKVAVKVLEHAILGEDSLLGVSISRSCDIIGVMVMELEGGSGLDSKMTSHCCHW